MKTKIIKPKPRVMWANIYEKGTAAFPTKEAAIEDDKKDAWPVALSVAVPVAVIPLDDIESLVESAKSATFGTRPSTHYEGITRKILTAAGIPCAKRRARK